jgi:hypothetical protein
MKLTGEQQAALSLVILSNVVASAVAGFNGRYFVASVLSFSISLFLWHWIVGRIVESSERSPFRTKYRETEAGLRRLSVDEARAKVVRVLQDISRFNATPAESENPCMPEVLGPALTSFFRIYQSVVAVRGEFQISRGFLSQQPYRQGTLKVGIDSDFCEYAAFPNDDQVLEVEGSGGESVVHTHPSIYHLVLFVNWNLYEYPEMLRRKKE